MRPKIKIPLSFRDKLIELLGWLVVILCWMIAIQNYRTLPDTIPIHFDASGNADGFGDKWNIFILPVISTLLYASLTILNRYPHIFNYPTQITEENAERQYRIATKMMRYVNLSVAIIFTLIVHFSVKSAMGESDGLGQWFLPLVIILTFLPIIYYLTKSFRNS